MQKKTKARKRNIIPNVGYRPDPWAQAANFSRQKLYAMSLDIRPRSVKVGRMRIIPEFPGNWLAKVGAQNE